MSLLNDDVAELLHRQLRVLNDRAEIARLCDRYVRHLDRDRDDDGWLSSVFTDDIRLTFPMGEYQGMDGLLAFQQMARVNFARTHHLSTNQDIELDGDHARVWAHLMAVHVPRGDDPGRHFDIGGHYEARVVRTAEGWRIRLFSFDLVWHAGEPPREMPAS